VKIKTRVVAMIVILCLLTGMVAATLFISLRNVSRKTREAVQANEIIENMTKYRRVAFEYLLYNEERARDQWQLTQDTIAALLNQELKWGSGEQEAIDGMKGDIAGLRELFERIVATRSAYPGLDAQALGDAQELEKLLVAQFMSRSQAMFTAAFDLSRAINLNVDNSQKQAALAIIIVILLLLTFSVLALALFGRSLLRSLGRLREGTEAVASGDLGYRVDIATRDELGQLAVGFNAMAEELGTSYRELEDEIAERKRVQDELVATRDRFEYLVSSGPVVIYTCEPSGDFPATFISENVREQFGYEAGEFVEDPAFWAGHIHPEDRERVFAELGRLYEHGYHLHEYRFRHGDGSWHWMRDEMKLIRTADGEPREILGCWIDVTGSKRKDQLIRTQRDLAVRLSGVSDLEEILRCSLDSILETSGMDCGGAYLFDEDSGDLELACSDNLSGTFTAGASHYSDDSPHARTVRAGEPLYEHYGRSDLLSKAGKEQEGLKAFAMVPVRYGGGVIGCVNVASHTLEEVPPELRDFLEILVGQLGQAIARGRLAAAIGKSEQRYHDLFESMREGILASGPDGRLVSVNPAAAEILGYKEPEELLGKLSVELYMDPAARQIIIEKLSLDGFVEDFEVAFRRKDGTSVEVLFSGIVRSIEGSKLKRIEGIFRDITERKRTEKRILRQSILLEGINQVLREALTSETDGDLARICLVAAQDLTDSKFGFIGEVNEAGLYDTIALTNPGWEACGIPESEAEKLITGMEIRGIWGKPIRDGASFLTNSPGSHPVSVGTPEGHPPITSFLGIPLKWEERTVGLLAVANKEAGYDTADQEYLENLTVAFMEALNRKRVELELERHRRNLEGLVEERTGELRQTLAELERSNAELEQFAYVASHDLQEPLRMVTSYMQLLDKRYRSLLDEDAGEFISYAVDGATRMQQLINDLLAFSRVGTRGKPFEPTGCEQVLEEAVLNLKLSLEENDADLSHDPLPVVMADASQLVQLFQNLISNAVKFRSERRPEIHIAAEREGGEWVFSVRDNGIGIDPDFRERIFQVFQRLHSRGDYPGTGIGLAICRKITDRHDGRIWVESEPGAGTTFYFTIPAENGG
jgi:PAS domain S-box-containing protein